MWSSYAEVDRAVTTIAVCLREAGVVPEALVRAYRTALGRSASSLVQRFYERLGEVCPEALHYFGA
jgi:hypothetical protein